MRYVYIGRPGRVTGRYEQECDPVLDSRGKCIIGTRGGPRNQLVVFADGQCMVVPSRTLRLREKWQARAGSDDAGQP